jgi:DNA-binding NtrC family response regulator
MQIQVPPLRQRPEEIPLLANHFMEKYASQYGKTVD